MTVSPWPLELGSPSFVKHITEEIDAKRVPSIPLEMLAEFAPAVVDAAPEEIISLVRQHRPASPAPGMPAETLLLDLFTCDSSGGGGGGCDPLCGALHFVPPKATEKDVAQLLREALTAEQPVESPAFHFEIADYPAATEYVFTVRQEDFPSREAWVSFCEANVKADLALATLNQIAAQFQQSLSAAAAADDDESCDMDPADPSAAATAAASAAAAAASAKLMPLSAPEQALAACARGLPSASSGFMEACPLTVSEHSCLIQLCTTIVL